MTQADALLFDKKHLQMTSSAQSVVVAAMYYYTPNTFNPMNTRILQFCDERELRQNSSWKLYTQKLNTQSQIVQDHDHISKCLQSLNFCLLRDKITTRSCDDGSDHQVNKILNM